MTNKPITPGTLAFQHSYTKKSKEKHWPKFTGFTASKYSSQASLIKVASVSQRKLPNC